MGGNRVTGLATLPPERLTGLRVGSIAPPVDKGKGKAGSNAEG